MQTGRSYNTSKLVSGSALLLVLAGAATDSAAAGSSEDDRSLLVSPAVMVALEEFQRGDLPGYFAVSENGSSFGAAYCRSEEVCTDWAPQLAREFCEKDNGGTRCEVFADQHKILRRGPTVLPDAEDVKLVRQGWRAFPAKLTWAGRPTDTRRWLLFPEDSTSGWLKLTRTAAHAPCYGAYSVQSENIGAWQMICGADAAASGKYQRQASGWTSTGRDLLGRAVEIVITFR